MNDCGKFVKIKEERGGLLEIQIAISRSIPQLDLGECIGSYEFGLIPRSLFASDGTVLLAYDKAKILHHLRGFAKLKNPKIRRKKWDRAHPIQTLFLETHHWHGQNTQIIITNNFHQCIYRQNTYGILLQNISTGLKLFWDDFPQKNSEWDLEPPIHFHSILGFLDFFSLHSPLVMNNWPCTFHPWKHPQVLALTTKMAKRCKQHYITHAPDLTRKGLTGINYTSP